MKFLTIILVTTILLLDIKPSIDLISLHSNTEQGCCDGKCYPIADSHGKLPDQKKNDDSSNKPCNPFQTCSSGMCILLCQTVTYIWLTSPEFSDLHHSYHPIFVSQFAPDIWQPPKIA